MEDDETFEDIFSRFKTFVVGIKVVDKGYTKITKEVDSHDDYS